MGIKTSVHLMNNPDSKLKAMVDVNLNDEFVVKGLRVMDSEKGPFVSMPQRKVGEDYTDTFHPITAEAREQLNKAVMEGYEKKLEQAQKQEQETDQKNDKGQKGVKKGQSSGKEQKANDATEQKNDDLSEEGPEEEIEEGPAMSM